MENTGKILFEDTVAHWYVAQGDKSIGPMTAADVYQKVLDREISWAHYVWKPGQAEWKRICDLKTFQAAVPQLPSAKPTIKKAPPRRNEDEKIWFIYQDDAQFGPFSGEEIKRFLQVGKVNSKTYVWRDGMQDWQFLGQVEEFVEKGAKKTAPPRAPAKPSDKRGAPRRPLIAKIVMANESSVNVAVCRDISIGGMQVLTDRIPGAVGQKIKMNVSADRIDSFVAEGRIVRVLEDGRGFSFRFERLSDEAKRSIEKYIDASR